MVILKVGVVAGLAIIGHLRGCELVLVADGVGQVRHGTAQSQIVLVVVLCGVVCIRLLVRHSPHLLYLNNYSTPFYLLWSSYTPLHQLSQKSSQ